MSERKIENYRKVLVVEGYSDLHFCAEFLEHLGKHEEVFIEDMKGRSRLEKGLKTLITTRLLAEKTHLAVLVDADDDGPGTTQGLIHQFKKLTGRDLTEGVWSPGEPNLGFFVAPTPGEVGEIEDLVWRSITEDAAHKNDVTCVNQFIDCMGAGPTATNQRIAKRRLGSLLAVRHEDDPRLGPAAQGKLIDFDAPAFDRLRTFLQGF